MVEWLVNGWLTTDWLITDCFIYSTFLFEVIQLAQYFVRLRQIWMVEAELIAFCIEHGFMNFEINQWSLWIKKNGKSWVKILTES